jgi:phosphonate transport system substrate-binding protein
MKIEFRPMRDGDALVDALINNKLDMVWLDGFNFIQAKTRSNDQVISLVQRAEDEKTRSVFVTTHDGITRLEDLKGRTFSFGSESSASGHFMPRSFLQAAHINPDTDMKRIYSGSPDATVAAVASGEADAGALSSASWEKLIEQGKADSKAVHVFYTTPGYHDYNWTVRADMDVNLRQKLTDAFLALDKNNGQDKEILDLQRASKFIPTSAENYSVIEAAASRAGLLK